MGSAELFFSSFLLFGGGRGEGDEYTHILREVDDLYIVLDTVHSTPPPIHGPSFSHSAAFSLDRRHAHAHTDQLHLLFSLSLSLFHPRTFFLSFFLARLARFICRVTLFRYYYFFLLRSFFSFSLLVIYTRARSHVCRVSHIQQHLNIVFSVIIKRNNDNI